jgi:NAD(P)-dependent dehydrogenase (short-subunit alcohol dehydrogenase family)
MNGVTTGPVAHFDLTGRRAIVLGSDTPAGATIAAAFTEAGADLALLPAALASRAGAEVDRAATGLDGLDILACALDAFEAQPFVDTDEGQLARVMARNFTPVFAALQRAAVHLLARDAVDGRRGNLVVVTHALGSRGLPNCAAYCAAHGAIANLIRALAQELAPAGISVNGIALGWMDWMSDRLDPTDEDAGRAVRFTLAKRAGTAEDVGALAVWLAGSGAGYVTGQVFPLDGGLTQHL